MTENETNLPQHPPRRDARTFTFRRTFTFDRPPSADDPNVTIVDGPGQTFEWNWGGLDETTGERDGEREPMTYYEALSGKPDPHREFFVAGRKWLNRAVTLTALAFPVIGIAIGTFSGADLQTVVLLGFGGAVIGLMFKTTFPKTPFD